LGFIGIRLIGPSAHCEVVIMALFAESGQAETVKALSAGGILRQARRERPPA
jgi:hypothetical protein